ncbi:MAG: hypothetical protein KDB84_03955, partial [Flavobacteriales bacterium]|nr:hypothetical protein [Flavobacteriales bacterium]
MWIASLRSTLVLAGAGICALHGVGQGCGTTVYDSGGSGGAYGNNQNLTYTYCAPPGQIMTINFTSFNTEAFYDELSIHAGPSNASPQIGIYSGTTLPGSYSTPPGGCLTLWFTSDGTVTAPGWSATLTCVPFVPPAGDCYYVLELTDSYGDGWGTSYVGVSINGGPYTNYSVTGSTFSVPIGVNIGDIIALNYNASGAWQGENAYTLSLGGTSVVFNSGTPPAAGISYATTVDCTPPPAPPQDCIGGVTICNSTAINNNSTNTGNVVDLNSSNQGCLSSQEQQGTWYFFSPNTTGTIGMTITPSGAVDYDFAIWGPLSSVSCPPSGPPLRCSYAYPPSAGTYLTGMANGYGDVSEAAGGIGVDGFVAPLTIGAAQVGQVYIMYIDNFDITGQAFSMDWNLSTPGMLDCTVLPVDLLDLRATRKERAVDVMWTTGSESGTERFVVQHSTNGTDFTPIGQLPA